MTNTPTTFFGWIIFLIQQYHGYYLQGLLTTLETSLAGTICGCFLGFLVGIIQATDIRAQDNVIKKILLGIPWVIAKIYVTIFRGTPMIVQAMVIYYGSSTVFGIDLKPFNAAIFIILLNTGAYMSETVRGGINSIDVGQIEGAKALGMGYVPMMIYIILPQSFKTSCSPNFFSRFLTLMTGPRNSYVASFASVVTLSLNLNIDCLAITRSSFLSI
jgi:putative lysine transport system permease protein